jgi:serine phosphatase RsbU (regulator of sigma subunit)
MRLGAAIGIGCAALLAAFALLGVFELLDLRLHDWRYRLRGPITASPRIALIEVDDPTIAAYRTWPLPRASYALLIAALEEVGAQAVGFDLLFLGENAEDPDGDRLLASVTEGRTHLVHAIAFLPEDATLGGGGQPSDTGHPALVRHGRPVTRTRIAAAQRVSLPYDGLLERADALGHTAVAVDRDGVVRRVPQFIRYGDWTYPSLAIRLVEIAARSDPTLPQFEIGEVGVRLHGNGRRVAVPVDAAGATAIVFAGDRPSFPQTHSMLRVLQLYRDGDTTALARMFRGKLVLIGTTAMGEIATDVGATPFATAAPLVYIHANAVNAALAGRFLVRPSAWIWIPVVLILGVVLGVAFSRRSLAVSAGVAVAAVALIAVMDYALFAFADVDVPPTAALVLPPLAWIAIEGRRRTVTERQAREREKELEVARGIQRRLLPSGPPATPEVQVFGVNVPAEAVGGDYYDWVPLGDRALAIVVGDVSGHGVPAALLMSHLRASFHAQARDGSAPREIVQAIHGSLARAIEPGRFATFFLAVVLRDESKMIFCNAGHNPPLLIRNGDVELLGSTGLPLALFEDAEYTDEERPFSPGDLLVLYSDGVTEAPSRQQFYGDERWKAKVVELAGKGVPPAEMGEALLNDVRDFAREELAADDVTIVVVRRV